MTVQADSKRTTVGPKLTVFADRLAPSQGALAFAIDWARRFQYRIQVIVNDCDAKDLPYVCAEASARYGLVCEQGSVDGREPAAGQLIVISRDAPAVWKSAAVQLALRDGRSGLLICPARWSLWTRALVVNHESEPTLATFAENVLLCRQLGVGVIVLTLARSERSCRALEVRARQVLSQHGMTMDFDRLVGVGLGGEIVHVAGWRRCQLVVLPRPVASPWWHWHRGDNWKCLLTAPYDDSLNISLLTLPQA